MCQTTPYEVLRVHGDRAEVQSASGSLWVTTLGLSDLRPGEFVIVHAGHALDRISRDEALEIQAIHAEIKRILEQPENNNH